MTRRLAHLALLLPLTFGLLAACGDDDGATVESASGTGSGTGSTASSDCKIEKGVDDADDGELHVTLNEYSIALEEDGAGAGVIQVEATNAGAADHELVIVRGTTGDLPVENGVVDEEGVELVGEIEPFPGGKECVGKFQLTAGTYTLFCGIVEEDQGESHFQEGMVTELEVK